MSLSRLASGVLDLNAQLTGPFFISTNKSIIEQIIFTCQKGALKSAINYITITFTNKGRDGTGNDIIAIINTNSTDPNSIEIVPNIAVVMNVLLPNINPLDVIEISKINAAAAVPLGYSSIIITERRI